VSDVTPTPIETPSKTPPTREQVHAAPKVLLHDHLDGGLRPQTIAELESYGITLPALPDPTGATQERRA